MAGIGGGEIQTSSSGMSCSSALAGAIRFVSGTGIQYCTSAAWMTLASGGGVTGTGSATAVAYWNSSSGLTYDTDGFYWDATNNRLGVGTNAPAAPLSISGTTTTDIARIQTSNNTGAAGLDLRTYGSGDTNTVTPGIKPPTRSRSPATSTTPEP